MEIAAQLTEKPMEELLRLLNEIRDTETRGGLLLALVAELAPTEEIHHKMAKHAVDEVRHGWMFTQLIRQLGGHVEKPSGPLYFDYIIAGRPDFWTALFNRDLPELTMPDVWEIMIAANEIECAAENLFSGFRAYFRDNDKASAMFREIYFDEEFHLRWVERELEIAEQAGNGQELARIRERYKDAVNGETPPDAN